MRYIKIWVTVSDVRAPTDDGTARPFVSQVSTNETDPITRMSEWSLSTHSAPALDQNQMSVPVDWIAPSQRQHCGILLWRNDLLRSTWMSAVVGWAGGRLLHGFACRSH